MVHYSDRIGQRYINIATYINAYGLYCLKQFSFFVFEMCRRKWTVGEKKHRKSCKQEVLSHTRMHATDVPTVKQQRAVKLPLKTEPARFLMHIALLPVSELTLC